MDLETIGGIGAGGIIGGILTYLSLSSKLKKYIREESGRGEEINVMIPKQPIMVDHPPEYVKKDTFDKHVGDTQQKFTKMESEAKENARVAAEGRSNIHRHIEAGNLELRGEIGKVKDDVADLPEKTINLLLKTKELNK